MSDRHPDVLEELTTRLPWSSGVDSDFLMPNEADTADRIAAELAIGCTASFARLWIRVEVALLYPIRSKRGWQAHEQALERWTEHVELALPIAKQAMAEATHAVRRAATGAYMRRAPRQAAGLAQRADTFGLPPEVMEQILAEEAAWWLRKRAVTE